MLADLSSAPAGTVVVLHACGHNPTGYDLPTHAWPAVIATMARRQLIPLLDIAYQGSAMGSRTTPPWYALSWHQDSLAWWPHRSQRFLALR
ncbi:aminotransferase class I/II-fold pyridoxal phosphate-dependent enzyme [Cupriavidus necator]